MVEMTSDRVWVAESNPISKYWIMGAIEELLSLQVPLVLYAVILSEEVLTSFGTVGLSTGGRNH
jgi:hypothetical protein